MLTKEELLPYNSPCGCFFAQKKRCLKASHQSRTVRFGLDLLFISRSLVHSTITYLSDIITMFNISILFYTLGVKYVIRNFVVYSFKDFFTVMFQLAFSFFHNCCMYDFIRDVKIIISVLIVIYHITNFKPTY